MACILHTHTHPPVGSWQRREKDRTSVADESESAGSTQRKSVFCDQLVVGNKLCWGLSHGASNDGAAVNVMMAALYLIAATVRTRLLSIQALQL
jgi:hypothetical protein